MQIKKATWDDVNGTSLQGYVNVTYAQLKRVFGQEHSTGDGYKVDAEWMLKFEDGTVATIYNYKAGKNYCGETGKAKTKITDWHVGGRNPRALALVEAVLGGRDPHALKLAVLAS